MVCFCAFGFVAPVADGFVLERYEAVACEFWCVAFGHCVSFVVVMLLAPLLRCGCFRVCPSLGCLCPPHFTAVRCWLPDCLGWTPIAFYVVRELCTVANTSITSLESSHEAGRTALPTFPCVKYQQSAIPYVALGRI